MKKLSLDYWRKTFVNLAATFEDEKVQLCQLDGAIGDGDHGASMARGFAEAAERLSSLGESTDVAMLFQTTGNAFLSKVGGVTGVIFGTFFAEAGKKAEGLTEIDAQTLAAMLENALEAVKKRGKVRAGDKSMVDALAPAVSSLKETAKKGSDMKEVLASLHEAARRGSEATKEMPAKVGRARYQKEKGIGHVDPGSVSVAIIFRTLRKGLSQAVTPKCDSWHTEEEKTHECG